MTTQLPSAEEDSASSCRWRGADLEIPRLYDMAFQARNIVRTGEKPANECVDESPGALRGAWSLGPCGAGDLSSAPPFVSDLF